ncbi:MAG TPA: hypothetical protein VJT72_13355 [Pseudonocardiaceae bacterium]|nr:hypothetical protein [Pseudonocardiaceae bacterium]
MSEGSAAAKEAGYRSLGRHNGSRAATLDAIHREKPNHGDFPPGTNGSRSVKGDGHVRVQAWTRRVLVDGQWIDDQADIERRREDDEVIRRMRR